jgi:PPK2 family polyphosphate:nucleotide phosphotransferase
MKLATLVKPYRIAKGRHFRLKDIDPGDTRGLDLDPETAKELLQAGIGRLAELQDRLYADDRWALLVIFQAMDAAGKDGMIKHVMSGVNPQGCQVYSFQHPSAEELKHDFLWRCVRALPERGRIGIFNRSYYEEVLIVRVHPEILRSEGVPDAGREDDTWEGRYQSITDFERHLHRNGTRVLKFFLHISKEEQRKRLLARIDDPEKNWKFTRSDIEERRHWKDYMQAYQACLRATSKRYAPWYVVPADDKPNARLIVSQIIVDTLRGLRLQYPRLDAERRRELQAIRRLLAAKRV